MQQNSTSRPADGNQTNQPAPFVVQSLPPERLPLFEEQDYFVCERKFYNTLPKQIIFPKVFTYNYSNERFLRLDQPTLLFGLKQNHQIITDPMINTNVHNDFIENSVGLILPELNPAGKEKTGEKILGNKRKVGEDFKNDLLKIIEADDKIKKDLSVNKTRESFYLRKSTFMTASINVGKKNALPEHTKIESNNHQKAKVDEMSKDKLTKQIEETFNKVQCYREGSLHPFKKEVRAKRVYTLKPLLELANTKFSEIQFDTDPASEVDNYTNPNTVKRYLMKFKAPENNEKEINLDEDKLMGLYSHKFHVDDEETDQIMFDYERDYRYNTCSNLEIFNTAFFLLNKENSTALYAPMDRKMIMKKYKKKEVQISEMDDFMEENIPKPKKEKDIVVFSVPLNPAEAKVRNETFAENGIKFSFSSKEREKRIRDKKIRIGLNNENPEEPVEEEAEGDREQLKEELVEGEEDIFQEDD